MTGYLRRTAAPGAGSVRGHACVYRVKIAGRRMLVVSQGRAMERWRKALDATAAIATVIAAGFVIQATTRRPSPAASRPADSASLSKNDAPLPTSPVSLEGAQFRGSADATVTILEFSDFQCPFCQRFAAETLPALTKDYVAVGKVLFAFKNLPLESLHPNAMQMAQAAECAGEQGRFWQVHDELFKSAKTFTPASLGGIITSSGVEGAAFGQCLASKAEGLVRKSMADAAQLGLQTTPAFLLGKRTAKGELRVLEVIRGARPLPVFAEAITRVLSAK